MRRLASRPGSAVNEYDRNAVPVAALLDVEGVWRIYLKAERGVRSDFRKKVGHVSVSDRQEFQYPQAMREDQMARGLRKTIGGWGVPPLASKSYRPSRSQTVELGAARLSV
jgi:hypothetical protein